MAVDHRVRCVVETYGVFSRSVFSRFNVRGFPTLLRPCCRSRRSRSLGTIVTRPDPVVALARAREELGDTFVVRSGGTTCVFTFGQQGLINPLRAR
jgi:hypothetical protein